MLRCLWYARAIAFRRDVETLELRIRERFCSIENIAGTSVSYNDAYKVVPEHDVIQFV